MFSGRSGALKFDDLVEVADVVTCEPVPSEQAGRVRMKPAIRIYIRMCFLLSIFKFSCNFNRYIIPILGSSDAQMVTFLYKYDKNVV